MCAAIAAADLPVEANQRACGTVLPGNAKAEIVNNIIGSAA
jgi:hypothetical protein